MSEHEDLLARLGALPDPAPLDDLRAERVRRSAQATLAEERRHAGAPAWIGAARRAWSRALMPALVTSAAASYLWWALTTAAALYR